MSKRAKKYEPKPIAQPRAARTVVSLLDAMKDGSEYGSIVGLTPTNHDLVPELRRAIADVEAIRKRRCICYVANVVQAVEHSGISEADHLPFSEMVSSVPSDSAIDVFLATPGGSAEQVTQFVDALRPRFASVDFLIPYKAMSAGTLWTLSGDNIWMDERASLGPIDPQVTSRDGTWVPAQSLITLLMRIEEDGAEALANGGQPAWTHLQIVNAMDYAQLGAAYNHSEYSIDMATKFLELYKFKGWVRRSSGAAVTPEDRHERADKIARQLCAHDRWKAHGHALKRDIITQELQIQISKPEAVPGLERAIRRLWALCVYVFDKTKTAKLIISKDYSFVRTAIPQVP